MRIFPNYSRRTWLTIVVALCAGAGLGARSWHLRSLASHHHFEAMQEGYTASAIQRPNNLGDLRKPAKPIRFDRHLIAEAVPHWQLSRYHASVRDVYLTAAKQPWNPIVKLPRLPETVKLPDDDARLRPWWNENFRDYCQTNPCFLDTHMSFTVGEPNMHHTEKLLSPDRYQAIVSKWNKDRGVPEEPRPHR